ncbi:MAG TPA: hypothetical protein DCM14_04130 [Clostridiales bacterium UBA8153]|nr:hypothetical protein [Clostridiales bacterium UBA8153]
MSWQRGTLASGERTMPYAIELQGPAAIVHVAGGQIRLEVHPLLPGVWAVHCGGRWLHIHWAAEGSRVCLHWEGQTYEVHRPRPQTDRAATVAGGLGSPMPGVVSRVLVRPGQPVQAGDPLYVVEAMKMEHLVRAVRPGRVVRTIETGTQVENGALVVEVEEGTETEHGP